MTKSRALMHRAPSASLEEDHSCMAILQNPPEYDRLIALHNLRLELKWLQMV